MKPRFTLTLVFLSLSPFLFAQVKFKVKLLPDNVTYQVLLRPDASYAPPFNAVPSAQVTLLVPISGFNVGTVTDLAGDWSHNSTIVAPSENPGHQYMVFGLQGATSAISFQAGVEVPLFNFTRTGTCTGAVTLIENTDPFMPPNSQSVNVGNQISIIGAGIGVNAYTGNYGNFPADCTVAPGGCGIEVFDVEMTPPSGCGIADGMIEITASNPGGLPLQYSVNDGFSWQLSPNFTGLTAGEYYYLWVRDIASICIVEIGEFVMDGPLAAAVTGVDLVDPTCGNSDGSITIHAFSENGGTLQFGTSASGPWQFPSTFSGLAAGTYSFWVRDIVNNCQNFVGTYALQDCPPQSCVGTFELESLGNGRFQVNMLTGVDYNFPDNVTDSLQVTLKVPAGDFTFSNLTSQTSNVTFALDATYTSPSEAPGYDYLTIILTSQGTQDIPYVNGGTVNLFTFENAGSCSGDSIFLVQNDDPFFPPNSQNADIGLQLSVSGSGGNAVVCIAGAGSVSCETVPPAEPDCIATYILEELPSGAFQVSMMADTTWTLPNNIVSSAQWTVKVPAGGFVPANLTSLVPTVSFSLASTYAAPSEDPSHDYISFILASAGTSAIPFVQGQKVPLFTFENSGDCQGGSVFLMDNENDPFFPPNSLNANVGQQLTVLGFGGADATLCIQNAPADDCQNCGTISAGEDKIICPGGSAQIDLGNISGTIAWSPTTGLSCTGCPNPTASPSVTTTYVLSVTDSSGCVMIDSLDVFVSAGPLPGFSAADGCEGEPINFTDTTTSIDAIISWNWDFGDGAPASSQQHPTHIFSNSGNFEVSLTVTTGGGCSATHSDFVTVFPSPGELPQDNFGICIGEGVTLQTPGGLTSASWSPATGLDNPNSLNPVASPAGTTTYTVSMTNSHGCTSQDQATVTVTNKPIIQNVAVADASNCSGQGAGGSITITASGVAPLEYSIDNGQTWQAGNVFSNLASGSNYVVLVRLASDICPVAWNGNPVTVGSAAAPLISDISFTHPSDCVTENGSIVLTASGGIVPLQYSINGGATWQASNNFENLGGGTYQISVSNAGGSCVISGGDVVLNQPAPPTILTPVSNFTLCEGFTSPVSIAISEDIQSQLITGQGSISFLTITDNVLEFDVTAPGDFHVTITGVSGCSVTEDFIVNGVPLPEASFTVSSPACTGGEVTLNFTGQALQQANLNWSLAGGQVVFSSPAGGGLPAGATTVVRWNTPGLKNINLTVSQSGCSDIIATSVNVTNFNPGATLDVSEVSTCGANDGAINLSLSLPGNYQYQWSGAGVTTPTAQDLNNLPGGTYNVTITENNSECSITASAQVPAPQPVNITSVTGNPSSDCTGSVADGSVVVTANGGEAPYIFNLYEAGNPNSPIATLLSNVATTTFQNVAAGAYSVEVIDDNDCTDLTSATVAAGNSDLEASLSNLTNTGCGQQNGSFSLNVSGGQAPYTYQIYQDGTASTSGNVSGTTLTLNNLASANYAILIFDANGCLVPQAAFIGVNPVNFNITETVTQPSCGGSDGSISLANLPQGATLAWQAPGGSLPPSATQTGLAAGAYTVTVSVQNGCSQDFTYILSPANASLISVDNIAPAACNGANGGVTFTVSGGNSFSYSILNSNLSGFGSPGNPVAVNGLAAGAYVIVVDDLLADCISLDAFVVPGATTPISTLATITPPSACGLEDASICVQIFGGSAPYEIASNLGNAPNSPVASQGCIEGLYEGNVVLTVTDANGCSVTHQVSLDSLAEPASISTLATIAPPSACGVEDASICVQITGGTAPYNISSNIGIAPNDPVASEGCVQGLYEGDVVLTVTDANGCSVTHEVSLDEVAEPALTLNDVTVTGNLCPDVFIGSIVANDTALHLEVYDGNNSFVGITPLTAVEGGTYTVVHSDGNCSAEIEVTVQAPPAWHLSLLLQAATCVGDDGSLTAGATGANGGYTFLWDTGDTTPTISGLSGDAIFSLTITDSEGCTTTATNVTVPDDCDCQDDLFSVDYFNVLLSGNEIEVCLPANTPDLSAFDLELDETEYTGSIDSCLTSNVFYGLGGLADLGTPPFNLEEWTYNGNKVEDFAFATVEQLVERMNDLDPTGNWARDFSETSVFGGAAGSQYGSLVISHLGTTLTLQVNTLAVTHPSIYVSSDPVHIFIATNLQDGCADTLIINVLEPEEPTRDTLYLTLPVGEVDTFCIPTNELIGSQFVVSNYCPSFTGNALVGYAGAPCVLVTGLDVGNDLACLQLCDEFGICDTTWLVIEVVDTSTALEIFNGFSPNEDGVNDFFKIKNIELYPENELWIFNRWGNRVFHRKGYTNADPWKGIYKNTWLPDESYFYLLDVNIRGKQTRFSGFVELRK